MARAYNTHGAEAKCKNWESWKELRPLRSPKRGWEDNTKMDLREKWRGMQRINLA
jgi:hypothetical protein